MEKYIINGGKELYGSIEVQTAKNSVLPILAPEITSAQVVITKNAVTVLGVSSITAQGTAVTNAAIIAAGERVSRTLKTVIPAETQR